MRTILIAIISLVLMSAAYVAPVASAAEVKSLRGDDAIDAMNSAPEVKPIKEGERYERAYRQQPPLIPHAIDKYEIDLKINQCLRCHDWPRNVQENAPKISETHYFDRNGAALDRVSRSRWFCTQCHVPQADAKPLVENDFEPARIRR